MSGPSAPEVRAVLRQLLRAIDTHLTRVAGNKQWRSYVLSEARRNAQLAEPAAAQQQLQAAREYADLINNITHHRVRGC